MKVKFIKEDLQNGTHIVQSFKIGQNCEVLAMVVSNYTSYIILNNEGAPYGYRSEHFEIVDDKKPDFWVSRTDKYGETFYAPESWQRNDSSFMCRYHEFYEYNNDFIPRIQFYRDCRDLYKIDVLLPDEIYIPKKRKVRCLSKQAYLLPTDKKRIYKFIDETYRDKNKNIINLTIGNIYNILEMRDGFWYKITDDLGKDFFYPIYMFEEILG